MLRWLILSTTLALWLGCMGLVYYKFRPRTLAQSAPGTLAALDAIFSDHVEPYRSWRIYVDLEKLNQSLDQTGSAEAAGALKPVWDGGSESTLREVGSLQTTLRRKHDTRAEELTELDLSIPRELNMPVLHTIGISNMRYESRTDISMDKGLETFKSTFKISGVEIEATSLGNRDAAMLNIYSQVWQNGKKLLDQQHRVPVEGKSAPSLEMLPFQSNREVRTGYSWDIVMLDTIVSMDTMLTSAAQPKIVAIKATCTGTRRIRFDGKDVTAFEVQSEDGKARAWYSADGLVLKQAFRMFDAMDLIVVRVDPSRMGSRRFSRPRKLEP